MKSNDTAPKGIVYLIGAGPGDPELLSLKAVRCLNIADVVVYDKLANPEILGHIKPNCQRIYVGKASNRHTMKQEDINQLLVDLAKEGKTVARLKGGDPFVFGRGGEEALLLKENNLPFEIVPGITSAISVPAYAGIPVTHRNVAASFAVITGHEDPTKNRSDINWPKLATAVDTLVFLMGVENLPNITSRLIEHGRDPQTPAAVIRWGTKPEQQVLTTTLEKACEAVRSAKLLPPAIFVVGEVVKLREQLAWFDQKPLFGKRIIVTRARAQASSLSSRLRELGADVLEVPSIKICPPDSYANLDASINKLAEYKWLIFTSVNGVEAFFARLRHFGKDSRALAGVLVCAIGAPTAQKLHEYGITADLLPIEFRAEGILEAMRDKVSAGDKVLIARATEAREILPDELRARGVIVDVAEAYKTIAEDDEKDTLMAALSAQTVDMITFTSSSTVTNFLKMLGADRALLKDVTIASIGPITRQTCEDNHLNVDITAEEFTIPGLIKAIQAYYKEV